MEQPRINPVAMRKIVEILIRAQLRKRRQKELEEKMQEEGPHHCEPKMDDLT
jgi:hypothetical protein